VSPSQGKPPQALRDECRACFILTLHSAVATAVVKNARDPFVVDEISSRASASRRQRNSNPCRVFKCAIYPERPIRIP
jgi:hypothetical protein